MKQLLLITLIILCGISTFSQTTINLNDPTGNPTAHLGWDDTGNSPLFINQNNQNRMLFNAQTTWTGLNGESGSNVNRITIPHSALPLETVPAWSMLHLWEGQMNGLLRRDWMNIGTSYSGNRDFMYTGLIERPMAGASFTATDAVIAWG